MKIRICYKCKKEFKKVRRKISNKLGTSYKFCSHECRDINNRAKRKIKGKIQREKIVERRKNPEANKAWLVNNIFKKYRDSAKNRGLNFELTKEEFAVYFRNHCWYCSVIINTIGLDRLDNAKGYVKGNVVSCCNTCNIMKRTLPLNVFIAKCEQIVKYNTSTNYKTCILL